ncbi:MAG: glycerophosphoryl diester phosphodiesterase membrane domain-containing protein, partial [Bacillota bacterium]|nr:glycerophosphoryl diester phosphodiesterase membrane domain-containing protein [Bacillota bacterium]
FRAMPTFFKYQIVTKLMLSAVIFPLFWAMTQWLIRTRGVGALSNSDLPAFLLSPQGVVFLLLGLAVILFAVLLELCGFITISARSLSGQAESSFGALLRSMLRILPRLFNVGSALLLVYLLVLIPLTGFGLSLSFLEGLRIPNFIMSVIESDSVYSLLLLGLTLIFLWLGWRWIFTFHFIVLGEQKPLDAMRSSALLVRHCRWRLLLRFFGQFLLNLLLAILILGIWIFGLVLLAHAVDFESSVHRVILGVLFLLQSVMIGAITVLFVPFEVHHLTILFRHFTALNERFAHLAEKYPVIPAKSGHSLLDGILMRKRTLAVLIAALILLVALPLGIYYDQIVLGDRVVELVGHRGGGGARMPENSIASIDRSIELAAQYVEIDVQRAKDGSYIINHDKDFKRLAGDRRRAQEMTLDEIKTLDIGRYYPGYEGERVPTMEELLLHCKGRIGIYIELKGSTADPQMADDIVAMVKRHGMERECVIMSLDYGLIRYVESTYPEMETGFCYFLAVGDPGSFETDIIILEEDAATDHAVDRIRMAGKKSVVWTVNKLESMEQFVASEVDGIITDEVEILQQVIRERNARTPLERYIDFFLGE